MALYGAEIWSHSYKGCCGEYQKLVNIHERTFTRIFQSAPKVVVVPEAGLKPEISQLNNRQRQYGYRLLAALRSQPTRDILPITLHLGEEQAEPGELTKGDDDWFKLIGWRREALGHQFGRTIAEGTSILTTTGTEHTERVELAAFLENMASFAGDKEDGAREAKEHSDRHGEMSF